MFIDTPFQTFDDRTIDLAPTSSGVYALYDGSETIYFGKAEGIDGIRGRLKSHKAGYEGSCTQRATYFNYEVTFNASAREKTLLTEYQRLWDKLPRCNAFIP